MRAVSSSYPQMLEGYHPQIEEYEQPMRGNRSRSTSASTSNLALAGAAPRPSTLDKEPRRQTGAPALGRRYPDHDPALDRT